VSLTPAGRKALDTYTTVLKELLDSAASAADPAPAGPGAGA
jgi:hypothetical protein